MRLLRSLSYQLRSLLRSEEKNRELDEEIQFHLDMQIDELVKSGMDREQARLEALRSFGGVEQEKENCRDAWGMSIVDELARDTIFALRQLRKYHFLSLTIIVSLAICMGANTAMFSIINSVLYRALLYEDSDSLVLIWNRYPLQNREKWGNSVYQFEERKKATNFQDMGIAQYMPFILSAEGNIEKVRGMEVSASYFSTLGVDARIGRCLQEDDMRVESGNVAILSHRFWRERFGGDRAIIGSSVILLLGSFNR